MDKAKIEKFDEDSMNYILKSKENQSFDRKQKITSKKKIAKTIAAFANTNGGEIVVGISDQNQVIGIDPEEEIYMIESANELHCHPKVELSFKKLSYVDNDPSPYESADKLLLLVQVEKAPSPGVLWRESQNSEEKFYIRQGDRSISIS